MVKGVRLLSILLVLSVIGCNTFKMVFTDQSPYEKYVKSLEKADLLKTPMADAWITAGKKVFSDSILVELPFTEAGFFAASEPEARPYQFDVKAGQVLNIDVDIQSKAGNPLFMDLFKWEKEEWKHLTHADTLAMLSYEFDRDQTCLLRIQPELLVDVYYSLTISIVPTLINPVSSATNASIQSFYGDIRDGGKRSHEGVDIFAPKGTPVLAPANGYISRVGNSGLGGKVIWMNDSRRTHSYYFAHLDSQLVHPGITVRQGDTIGLVGNTGNARTTPPHLHFGIYQRGSRDPLFYIKEMKTLTKVSPIDTSMTRQAHKTLPKLVNLRSRPGTSGKVMEQLEQDTYVKVIGKSNDWYRILLPDRREGYIYQRLVTPVAEGKTLTIDSATLLSAPHPEATPIKYWDHDSLEVIDLARFENYKFVKMKDGLIGWIKVLNG